MNAHTIMSVFTHITMYIFVLMKSGLRAAALTDHKILCRRSILLNNSERMACFSCFSHT